MSLLMDALKKAEREREAQASKEQGGEETETPQELSLDPMERPPEPVSPTDEHDEPWDILGEPGDVSHGFDLSLSDSDLNLDSPPETDPVLEADSAPEPEPSYTPHSLEGMDDIPLTAVPGDDLSVEDTSSTMPSMKAVKASVDRYFDGSQSVSMSMQMPLEQDDATTVVQRRASDEEAQAAAQTVFSAKASKSRGGMWIWIFLVPLVVILLIGTGFFYYLQKTGGQVVGGSDLIALLGGSSVETSTTGVQSTSTSTQTQTGELATTGETGSTVTQTELGAEADTSSQGVLEPALSDVLDVDPPAAGDLTPIDPEPIVVEEPVVEPVIEEVLPSSEELLASAGAQIQSALGDGVMSEGSLGQQAVSFTRTRPEP